MERKERLKAHTMPEPVLFWKWINPTTVGIVTAGAVFHWTLDGTKQIFFFPSNNNFL